ncbi:MAG: FmdB family zinc ribbon protein [Candidatus Nitrosocaldus sp.]
MPTYDYVCSNCGYKFELFERMKDDKQKQCPKCNQIKAKRQLGSGSGVIFKGPGFYVTDKNL